MEPVVAYSINEKPSNVNDSLSLNKGSLKNTPSYFDKRSSSLGITDENNKISLWKNDITTTGAETVLKEFKIFREVPLGIEILVYTLDRYSIRIESNGNRWKKDFCILRLEKPKFRANGDVVKYVLPKGSGTHPFFPPNLIEKFEKTKKIETLYLVEGYFKAFKASLHGLDIIGLSSITHMRDKQEGTLHPDIIKLMLTCKVKRMVWLTDGDALDITQKEITEGLDLSKRPKQFFSSVQTFHTLLADYNDIDKWFIHIDTDSILENNDKFSCEDVKGIDDLLISFKGSENDIIEDLQSISRQSKYFQKFNITYGLNKVYNHFKLRDIKEFYLFHVERRPEIKNKEFIFNGTRYQYDEGKAECIVKIPGDAKLYFRVGDDYYKFIIKPNQFKQKETSYDPRRKATIIDDHGPHFTIHIPKYEAFCNVPDHFNFEQVINNCFNVYSPVDFTPDDEKCTEGDCPSIINFLYHLFGEKKASYIDPDTNEIEEYRTIDLALDYLQILYQNPSQKLPILCLVSRENNTGKSTFGNFLRMMLGANVAIVGNEDLQSDFNAHWATKSVVICDESKIDKHNVINKIKNLSTARKVFMNAKGRGQVELDCFIKFVLITNEEDSFIYATDEDIRYWVIKVPVLKKVNTHLLEAIKDEMPAFLSFLNNRKILSKDKNRMWFHPDLLKTEALKKIIAWSKPQVEKEIRHYLKEMFLDTGAEKILMTTTAIWKEIFKKSNKYQDHYLARIIRQNLMCDTYHVWTVEGIDKEFNTETEATSAAESRYPEHLGHMVLSKISKKGKVIRHSYPKLEVTYDANGKSENKIIEIADNGRPFIFNRNDFVTAEENSIMPISEL
jgi:hypothetical protein